MIGTPSTTSIRRVLAGTAVATLVASLGSAPGSAAAATAPTHSPRTATTWMAISDGTPDRTSVPTLARVGTDLVVSYRKADGRIATTTLDAAGRIRHRANAVTGWSRTSSGTGLLTSSDDRLTLFFGGQRDTADQANPYSKGYLYSTSSLDGGQTWTLDSTAVGPYTTSGQASVVGVTSLPDGTPLAGWAHFGKVNLGSPVALAALEAAPDRAFAPSGWDLTGGLSLVREGDAVVAAWQRPTYQGQVGVGVRQVHPTLGEVKKAPGTNRGFHRQPLVSRNQGGTFTAYCVGAGTYCSRIVLWRTDTDRHLTIPGTKDAEQAALGVTPDGRVWAAWTKKGRVLVARSNPQVTRFGAVVEAGSTGATAHRMAIDGASGRGDLLVNDGDAVHHRQVLAGLSVSPAPAKVRLGRRSRVTFTVLDAGAPVRGARVKALGGHCTTNAKGKCRITFKGKKVKPSVTATRSGYAPGKAKITFRR